MMTRFHACTFVIAAMIGLVACDETSKQCNDAAAPIRTRIAACGELCDKEDAKACATQTEIATKECLEKGDAGTCEWMCRYAKLGQDLYCKKHEEVTAAPAAAK
jgi:hypothetical protein